MSSLNNTTSNLFFTTKYLYDTYATQIQSIVDTSWRLTYVLLSISEDMVQETCKMMLPSMAQALEAARSLNAFAQQK